MTGSNTDVFRLYMLNVTCMIAIVTVVVVDDVLGRVREETKNKVSSVKFATASEIDRS